MAVSGTQKLHAGSSWDDRYGRVTTSYTVQPQRCDPKDSALLLVGPNKALAIS